jgi:hypothetical protein
MTKKRRTRVIPALFIYGNFRKIDFARLEAEGNAEFMDGA